MELSLFQHIFVQGGGMHWENLWALVNFMDPRGEGIVIFG